jgi:RNA polymerase sigma-70 factor (ECF subfamily)
VSERNIQYRGFRANHGGWNFQSASGRQGVFSRVTDSVGLRDLAASSTTDPGQNRFEDEVVKLFDHFREPLLRYLASFGLGFQDGEDVIQDTFLSLFQHLRAGKSRENLGAWLFRVAHNLALKRRYRIRREADAETGTDELVIDPAPSAEDGLVRDQTQQRMMAVFKALREQDRRCLIFEPKAFAIGTSLIFSIFQSGPCPFP